MFESKKCKIGEKFTRSSVQFLVKEAPEKPAMQQNVTISDLKLELRAKNEGMVHSEIFQCLNQI